jgi:RNA polymerase sigma factor (sigma-70 family)
VAAAADDELGEVERRLSPRRGLERALAELPPHERRALELRIVDELPYESVAELLDIRPAAARLRVSPALRRLALTTKETP